MSWIDTNARNLLEGSGVVIHEAAYRGIPAILVEGKFVPVETEMRLQSREGPHLALVEDLFKPALENDDLLGFALYNKEDCDPEKPLAGLRLEHQLVAVVNQSAKIYALSQGVTRPKSHYGRIPVIIFKVSAEDFQRPALAMRPSAGAPAAYAMDTFKDPKIDDIVASLLLIDTTAQENKTR